MRYALIPALAAVVLVSTTLPAHADLTAFVGANTTPSNRATTGFGLGFSLLVVGLEFEYSDTRQNELNGAARLQTGMFNLLAQTPFAISGIQLYGTAGAGLYRERGSTTQETHGGTNIGGGVKIALAGPLRLRLDYRVFSLKGAPQYNTQHRFYTGLNLAF